MVVGQSIHGTLGKVETSSGMVDGENINGFTLICNAIAGAALIAIMLGVSIWKESQRAYLGAVP